MVEGYVSYEIDFADPGEAAEASERLRAAGFDVEATGCCVRAGIAESADQESLIEVTIEGLDYDPVIAWQRTRLSGFASSEG